MFFAVFHKLLLKYFKSFKEEITYENKKIFLLVMTLIFINFLNLNASQKRTEEMEATSSLISSTKLNLVQKNNKKIFTIEFIVLMENYLQKVSMN